MPFFEYKSHNLYYMDEGNGFPIVFVHGTPTNSSEYEKLFEVLKINYRCICIDHLGFGKSAKPINGDYSIEAHTDRLNSLLQYLGINQFHLVVHDFGGAIGLPLTFHQSYSIISLTLLNTWFWPLIETEPQMKFQKILVSSGLLPLLYKYLNFSPKVLYKLGWGKHSNFSKTNHQKYIDQFPTANDRSGTIAFLKQLFAFDNSCWKKLDAFLKNKELPIQIVWGSADKLISTKTLSRWIQILPYAKVIELDEVGHYVAEEAPEILVKNLKSFFESLKKFDI